MLKRINDLATLTPAFFWLSIFLLVPMCIIAVYSFYKRGVYGGIAYDFTLDNYFRLFDPLYFKTVQRSVYFAVLNTVLCLMIGYPLAYFISSQSRRWKAMLLFLVVLPFWTNFLIRTYSWMLILRAEGPINSVLLALGIIDEPLILLFTGKAVVIGLAYTYLPFMVLPLYASIEKLDRTLLDAALDLGSSPVQTFWHVTLPLTRPGIVAGCVLVFVPSLGEFVIPDLLGGARNLMIGNVIKDQFLAARDWPFGAAFAVILILIVLIFLLVYIRFGPQDAPESAFTKI